MLKNRSAMSPLLATILLITFAISLGALVMSIGKQVEPSDSGKEINISKICSPAKFEILNISGHPLICFDKETEVIKFTAINSGTKSIDSLKIIVVAKKLYTIDERESTIPINSPFEKEIRFNSAQYGTIREVIFMYRIIGEDDEPVLCLDNQVSVSPVELC